MKSFITLGFLFIAMNFCGLSEKLSSLKGGTNTASNSSSKSKTSSSSIEKPELTAAQQSIENSATETKWDEQGLSWKLPAGWKKSEVKKLTFNYSGPDNAFFGVN